MITPSLFIFIFPWDKYKPILKYKVYKQKQSHDLKCVVRSEKGSALLCVTRSLLAVWTDNMYIIPEPLWDKLAGSAAC